MVVARGVQVVAFIMDFQGAFCERFSGWQGRTHYPHPLSAPTIRFRGGKAAPTIRAHYPRPLSAPIIRARYVYMYFTRRTGGREGANHTKTI